MSEINKKINICGVLVAVNPTNFNQLSDYLMNIEGCEIIESKDNTKLALVIEDTDKQSAYDIMEQIKNHSFVLSITLINHFFE